MSETTTKTESMVEKIQGLLAKAESTNFPEEAAAFRAGAEKLMLKHSIDEAMLAMARTPEERWTVTSKSVRITGTYPMQKTILMTAIAKVHAVKVIRTGTGKYTAVTLIGTTEDIADVELLFTSLVLQGTGEMLDAPGSSRGFRANFWLGFTSEVSKRMKRVAAEAKADAEAAEREAATSADDGPVLSISVGLALVDKSRAVQEEASRLFPRVSSSSYSAPSNGYNGRSHGAAAGQRANVGARRAVSV